MVERRPIPGLSPYLATAGGEIVNGRTGRTLKPQRTGIGYLGVELHGKRFYIHRLITLAFHGPGESGQEVAHTDGTRSNNVPGNLSWKSRSANHMDKHAHGTMALPNARITSRQAAEIRARFVQKSPKRTNSAELAAEYGIQPRQIRRIAKGQRWRTDLAT